MQFITSLPEENTIQTIFLDIKKLGGDRKSDIAKHDSLIILLHKQHSIRGRYLGVFDYKYIDFPELNNFHFWAMLFGIG